MSTKKGILERLAEGPVIGDGGFLFALEKRGYVQAGGWTPESTVKHPEAVRQLHREFLRAGADVMQAFTFYANESKLTSVYKDAGPIMVEDINREACLLAREVADEGGALVSGSLSKTPSYKAGKGKAFVQEEYRKQLKIFSVHAIDFVICEYFLNIELMEWAIETAKEFSMPVAATMTIGPKGDLDGVSVAECAIRMAKAGADIVGINCNFGPDTCLRSISIVKKALEEEGLKRYLIVQPFGFHTPETDSGIGYMAFEETPFALEPRTCTRFDIQQYARRAYEMGINYIGGCCGFEPYHIRAISEELSNERNRIPEVTKDLGFVVGGVKHSSYQSVRDRTNVEFWKNLKPSTGRPYSAAFSDFDATNMS